MQPVADVAQLQLRWTDANAGVRVNSLYFELAGGWDDVLLQELVDAAQTAYVGGIDAHAPDNSVVDCPLTQIAARDLSVAEGAVAELEVEIFGTNAALMASSNNAAVVNFQTAGAGAPRKGRVFWPFVPEADVGYGGNLTAGFRALFGADYEIFVTALETEVVGADHVVVSRFSKAAVPAPPHERPVPLVKTVASYAVRQVIGSQRDRRVGEGG